MDNYERVITALKNLKRGNTALEQECEHLKAELSVLNDQRVALEQRLAVLKTQEETQRKVEANNYELKMKIQDLTADHEEDVEKLVSLKQVFEKTVVELCKERKKRQRIEAKTAKIIENIQALTKIAQSLQAKPEQVQQNQLLMKKLEEKKLKWKENKKRLQETVQDLQLKRDEALEAARNYQIQIDDRAGLVEQLEARVERRNRSIADLEKAIQDQTEQYETQLREVEKQKAEIEDLKSKQDKLKETLRQSVVALTSTKKKYDKERDKLASTRAYMRQFQTGFAEKLKEMREASERETQQKVEALESRDREKQEELEKLQAELAVAKEQFETENAKLQALEAEREKEKKQFLQTRENYETRFQTMQKIVGALTQTSLCMPDF